MAARPAASAAEEDKKPSLKDRLGLAVGRSLLESEHAAERLRGVQRLGALGTPEAVRVLVEGLESGLRAPSDVAARLEAVRALSKKVQMDGVRQMLVRELHDTSADGRGVPSPLAGVLRDTAALALARSGDKKAVTALVSALGASSGSAASARAALLAAPPPSVEALLEAKKPIAPALVSFLGELGDLRALPRLRALVGSQDLATKAAAVVSLATMGDPEGASVARAWGASPDPELRRAGARVLGLLGAPDAGRAIGRLLERPETRVGGLELALAFPSAALGRPLVASIDALPPELQPDAMTALGRVGGDDAIRALLARARRADADARVAVAATAALATARSDAARSALSSWSSAPPKGDRAAAAARRMAVRAAVVRAVVLGDSIDGLTATLRALEGSRDVADRSVAVFGLVATGARTAGEAVASACERRCDPSLVAAAARGAMAAGKARSLEAWAVVLERAARDGDRSLAEAAGLALVADPSGGEIAASALAVWAESGGVLAPLAARALATRDGEPFRPRIERLLSGSDPVVRAHTALGLATSPRADASGLLVDAYRFEPDHGTRRAVVRALALRDDPRARAALALAAELDPDPEVRASAALALVGRRPPEPGLAAPGRALWVLAERSDAGRSAGLAARVSAGAGHLALPVVADPDGTLLVLGLPLGDARVQLAPAPAPGDASRP